MSDLPESTLAQPEIPTGRMAVAAFRRRRRAEEFALVVLSMQLPYWLHRQEGRYYLCVPAEEAEAVSLELEKYRRESRRWPPQWRHEPDVGSAHPWSLACYGMILAFFFLLQAAFPAMDRLGMMDARAVAYEGQLWRPLTALTLHAHIGHLAGNLLSGICFGLLINRAFGYGLGWLLILASGVLGNSLALWIHLPEGNFSIGASTAVFGALGILVARGTAQLALTEEGLDWKRGLLPIAGGLTLLGLTGMTGENVDIGGHVGGFVAGLVLGLFMTLAMPGRPPGKTLQAILGWLTLGSVAAAWSWALLAPLH